MSADDSRKWLAAFQLPYNATAEQVDTQYFKLTANLLEEKNKRPEEVKQKQEEIDSIYYELLKHFIFDHPSEQAATLSVDDIDKHRHTAPPRYHRLSQADLQDITEPPQRLYRSIEKAIDDETHEQNDNGRTKNEDEKYKLVYSQGNLFENAPDQAVIVHATNCQGVWGAGIALELRIKYPAAYRVYQNYCSLQIPKSVAGLAGSCLLIQPQYEDYSDSHVRRRRHYIACLFTSVGYGKPSSRNPGKDAEQDILMNTDSALNELRSELEVNDRMESRTDNKPGPICSTRFNSGLFDVSWHLTEELIERAFHGFPSQWTVFVSNTGAEKPTKPMQEGDGGAQVMID